MPTVAKDRSFTALAVKSLPIPDRGPATERFPQGVVKQIDYRDPSTPGLSLRVSSTGAKTWTFVTRLSRDGQVTQARFKIGPYAGKDGDPGVTLAQARRQAEDLRMQVQKGEDPKAVKYAAAIQHAAANGNTFLHVVERFLKEHHPKGKPALRPKTLAQYTGILRGADCAPLHARPMAEITRHDVIALLDRIQKRGRTRTANVALAVVRKLCHWSIQKGLLVTAPTDHLEPPAAETMRTRHLFGSAQFGVPSELALAWRAFDVLGVRAALPKLLLLTGQRRSEVADMQWSEVKDLNGAYPRWFIHEDRAKTGKPHVIPLCPTAAKILREIPRVDSDPYVFHSTGDAAAPGDTRDLGFSKMKMRIDAQIATIMKTEPRRYAGQFAEPWRLHDLRRTVETGLAELGVAREIRDALSNHAKDSIQAAYNQADHTDAKRIALLTWERHLAGAIKADAPQLKEVGRAGA